MQMLRRPQLRQTQTQRLLKQQRTRVPPPRQQVATRWPRAQRNSLNAHRRHHAFLHYIRHNPLVPPSMRLVLSKTYIGTVLEIS